MSILEKMLERAVTRSVAIDQMRARHVGQVMEIERTAYPRQWSARVFHDELREQRAGRRRYFVARRGSTVLGYGGAMFVTDRAGATVPGSEAHITNVAVHPNEQRAGVATRLLVALASEAIRRGCSAWTLEVRESSTGAQALYRRFGFAPTGVRPKYYENGINAIVMWCHDIDSADYTRRLEELTAR